MKKVTILSIVTASLLLVGCGTDKRDNTEPAGKLMNQVTVENSADMDSNVQPTLKIKAVATDELKEELIAEIRSELEQRAELKAELKAEIIKELLAEIKSSKLISTTASAATAPLIELSSIGTDKSVGEIITAATGATPTKATTADTDATPAEATTADAGSTPAKATTADADATPAKATTADTDATPTKATTDDAGVTPAKAITADAGATPAKATTADTSATPAKATTADAGSTQDKPFDYKLTPTKISENVWCFFGAIEPPTKENAGNMANNCYIKTSDSYVVMDTGPSYQFAKQAYESMKKIADLPVSHIFISHEHDDHWLGNDFYKKEFNTKLIGPESVNTNYKEGVPTRMFNVLPKNAIDGTHIIKLDETPKEKQTLVIGGEKFDIIPMDTKAHTGDDIFVYMPDRKVLFAGDLVMNGRITSGRHGSVMGQLKALAMMQELDWKILIPGHGVITDGTAMDEAKMYFTLTKDRVLQAIEDDVDATEINEVVKLIEFKDKAMYDILNAHNIGFAFDELEMLD